MKTIVKKNKWIAPSLLVLLAGITLILSGAFRGSEDRLIYRSPETVSFSPDNRYLAVNDLTLNTLYLISVEKEKILEEFPLQGKVQDILWLDEGNLLLSEYETGKVLRLDIEKKKITKEYKIGPNPFHMDVHNDELWIGQYGLNRVKVVDLSNGRINYTIDLPSLPWDIQIVPGQNMVLVANQIPANPANGPQSTTGITLIDLDTKNKIRDILLPHGSSNLRHLEISANGKWAYGVHTRGKTAIPTSQLENGWVNTNMLSIIDLENREWYTTVILDQMKKGAANPWDVVYNEGDGSLLVSLEGVNELATVSICGLHGYLEGGKMPPNLMKNMAEAYTQYNVWEEIKNHPCKRTMLMDQISALYAARLIEREKIPLQAPRGMDLSGDGELLAIAGYYSGAICLQDMKNGEVRLISLGEQSEPDQVREGEIWFHDATTSLESWLGCATCHPHGRNDGLNWDLLNDGIGNPKNTKSLVLSEQTPPVMWSGVRARAKIAVVAGFHFINFYEATEEKIEAVKAYIASLSPEKSPYAKLQETDETYRKSIERGKTLFTDRGCMECHTPPLYTDKNTYEFKVADERGINKFDVPTMTELWRTGPFWHDGRKQTLEAVMKDPDLSPCGGAAGDLNKQDLEDLSNFLLSL